MRKFDDRAYPQIWHKGKRELLHRVIYMEATGETLTAADIIHHRDENPFNRHPSNLERLSGNAARADHLAKHNFHRRGFKPPQECTTDFSEFGF